MADRKARDLILALANGSVYENGKLKPAVRELQEYIEGLESANKTLVDALKLVASCDPPGSDSFANWLSHVSNDALKKAGVR